MTLICCQDFFFLWGGGEFPRFPVRNPVEYTCMFTVAVDALITVFYVLGWADTM